MASTLQNVKTKVLDANVPFGRSNKDSLNPGMLDNDGNCLPMHFTAHVNDNLYAEISLYLKCIIAASIVSVDDAFGGSHEYQENVLSDKELNLLYKELHVLLGKLSNILAMTGILLLWWRDKIILLIEEEGWLDSRTSANNRDIARLLGLLELKKKGG